MRLGAQVGMPLTLSIIASLFYFNTLAPGVTWANSGADSGDLITAAAVLGIPHPTGYPTYILLARLFQFLPVGTLAYRTNLLSAVAMASAAGLVGHLVQRAYDGAAKWGVIGGLGAGFVFATAPLVWSQSVVAEVYGLHILFIVALLCLMPVRGNVVQVKFDSRCLWLSGLIFGLGLGNHITLIGLLPPWLAVMAWSGYRPTFFSARRVLYCVGGIALGALIYFYIPLRAAANPSMNWGNAATWDGFWWLVSAEPYRALALGLPTPYLANRIQTLASLLVTQISWLGLGLALIGVFIAWVRAPRLLLLTLWMAVTSIVFAAGYNTFDWFVNLLPAILALAIWLGLGAASLLERVSGSAPRVAAVISASLLLLVILQAIGHLPEVDASRDHRAEEFARRVLDAAPPAAMIFTNGDDDTFPLWYFHFALNERPDLIIVVKRLLTFDWYRLQLQERYNGVVLPNELNGDWKTFIRERNARPVCETLPHSANALIC
ncbi:MAG: DUF2723 domain-containing protein [Chloroflexi bacterium]|nr:DUF2723 domain-containing protein [Chloroflexota bacterium]